MDAPATSNWQIPNREDVRKAYHDWSMYSPYQEDSFGYKGGQWLGNLFRGPNALTAPFDHGGAIGAGSGGLLGAGAGWLGSKAYNMFADQPMSEAGGAGLGALVGALAGGFRGHFKANSSLQDSSGIVMRALSDADDIPGEQKITLMGALNQLSPWDIEQLARVLLTAGGFGAGAMIARFMAGKGLIPSLLGGLAGAFMGHSLQQRPINSIDDIYG